MRNLGKPDSVIHEYCKSQTLTFFFRCDKLILLIYTVVWKDKVLPKTTFQLEPRNFFRKLKYKNINTI